VHRASYDTLCKQYTAKASPATGRPDYYTLSLPRKSSPSLGALFHSQESDDARSFLEATKGYLSTGMKISRKLKIDVSPSLFPLSLLLPATMKTEEERIEKHRGICARARHWRNARKEGGKVGYDMSGMLYDPIFQKITFCPVILLRLTPYSVSRLLFVLPVISFSALIYVSLSFVLLNLARMYVLRSVFAYRRIVRLIL